MATKMPPESPEGKAFQLFADKVEELSKGQIEIEVYPSEMLGTTEATLENVREGVITVYPEGEAYVERYIPEFATVSLAFVFKDRDHFQRFYTSPMVEGWRERLRNEFDIRLLGDPWTFVRGPYRVLISTRPVLTLADLQGMKFRMAPSEMLIAIWNELGANVIVLPWTEIYEGLQRGTIASASSPVALVESMKFQEVAKYILRTDAFPQGMGFMTNNKAFESLSPELQEAVLEAHRIACKFSQEIMRKTAEDSIARMVREEGVTFIRAPMDEWRKKVEPLYAKWEKEGRIPAGIIEYIKSLE